MTTANELTYRDVFAGAQDLTKVYGLLWDVFGLDVSPLGEMNLWDPTYRAFCYLDETGTCVANVATFTLALVINGRSESAMGIQSVATRAPWRHRGLSHALMQRALQWCDANAGLTFLMTTIPGFYEPMGFRILPQFAYVGDAPIAVPHLSHCRRLDLGTSADQGLLVKLLRRRSPVSARFAVDGSPGAFALNLLAQPELSAWFMATHDAVVVTMQRPDGTICVVDVAAREIPGLSEILGALGVQPRRVEVHFPPDRLGWSGTALAAETSTTLMVRGEPGHLEPFMVPETAAF